MIKRIVWIWMALGGFCWSDAPRPSAEQIDVEPVWAGHPVGFCLLTMPPYQFVAYYDASRRMTVAQRRLDESIWATVKLDSVVGWDSHNYVTLAVDRTGRLHLSGNMHVSPLVYFRSQNPWDARSLRRVMVMTGDREQRTTYPVFMKDTQGCLIFRYRDGKSGDGDDIYNVYDETLGTWSRLLNQPLISGGGRMNAYATMPEAGLDGHYHMAWVWRDTPDCSTAHDVSYAKTADWTAWTDSYGRPILLPITPETGEIVDPVPVRGGLLNVKVGFDSSGGPVLSYHKYDAAGDSQVYVARRGKTGWQVVQVSDWKGYRWDFAGGGTIRAEVSVGAVASAGEGKLMLGYRYGRGTGTWILDEKTLRPIPGARPPPQPLGIPRVFMKLESPFPGMRKKTTGDVGVPPLGVRYFLTWETLEQNRDRPRPPPYPAPSMLRVVKVYQ